jgi:hypothetical protein
MTHLPAKQLGNIVRSKTFYWLPLPHFGDLLGYWWPLLCEPFCVVLEQLCVHYCWIRLTGVVELIHFSLCWSTCRLMNGLAEGAEMHACRLRRLRTQHTNLHSLRICYPCLKVSQCILNKIMLKHMVNSFNFELSTSEYLYSVQQDSNYCTISVNSPVLWPVTKKFELSIS